MRNMAPSSHRHRGFSMQTDRRSLLIGLSRIAASGAAASALPRSSAHADAASGNPLPQGLESSFANVNGIRMHYMRAGAGPLVLLLHGWPQTWFAWQQTIPQLSTRYTVIAPDLRGCGLSERTVAGYDKRTIAEDLSGLIAAAGFANAHVVGHDMGGKAAYVLALMHPQSVSKLVLADCLLPGTENTDSLHGGAWHYGFHMAPEFPEMLTEGRERAYIAAQIRAWSRKKDAVSEAAIDEYARHYATPGGMTAGFNYYRALREDARSASALREQKLSMPVMTITGRFGVGDKLANALAPQADRLTRVVAEDCGHFVMEEAPDLFVRELKRFLA